MTKSIETNPVPYGATPLSGETANVRRIGVLTGGGDAPGLNAVLRGLVKTANQLGMEVLGSEDGFDGLIRDRPLVKLTGDAIRGILPRGGSILGCSNRANPFAYPTKHPDGKTTYADVSKHVVERIRSEGLDVLVMVGGDGTMSHAKSMIALGVPVVGVPKTIDNDLHATDLTFGFDTAVATATWAIDALHSTAEAHDRVMILELMGRDAGWIALSAGIAGGADVVLIPEIPYDIERVIKHVQARNAAGSSFSIIVVGEGAHAIGGAVSTISSGAKGHLARLGGAAHALGELLKDRLDHEVRVTVLGHLQRGGSPTARDRTLGSRFGVKAAELCKQGRFGRMVSLRGQNVTSVSIADIDSGVSKLVPLDGELVRTARALGMELGAAAFGGAQYGVPMPSQPPPSGL